MAVKGFNVKTNLGGFKTTKTAFGTTKKKGPAYKPKPAKKQLVGKPIKPAAKKPNLGLPTPVAAKPAAGPRTNARAVPDALYNQQVDTATREQTARLGQLGEQERQVKFDYGLDDPTNPFSRANALKKSYLENTRAASASLAAQGQLYSGAHERALARTRYNNEQAQAALRQAYDQALNQISDDRTGAKFTTEEQRNQAFQDWLARAPDATDYEQAQPDPAAPQATASRAASTGKAPKPMYLGSTAPVKAAVKAPTVAAAKTFAKAQAKKHPAAAKKGATVGVVSKGGHGGVGAGVWGTPVKPKAKTPVKPKVTQKKQAAKTVAKQKAAVKKAQAKARAKAKAKAKAKRR